MPKAGKEVVKKKEAGLPAVADEFFDDSGLGFENADKDAYSIPFLVILQTNSPQTDTDSGAYVEGAKPGMFLNTATNRFYKAVDVVACKYERKFVEWVPRDQGGGFRGQHDPASFKEGELERDDRGIFHHPNGNELRDTRYHYLLVLDPEDGPMHAVLGLTSTQIKASRNWMTRMDNLRATDPRKNVKRRVSMMAGVWTLSTVTQKNEKGSWKGIKTTFNRILTMPDEAEIYLLAKEFNHQVSTGKAKAEAPVEEAPATDEATTDNDLF